MKVTLRKVQGDVWVADDIETSEWSKGLPRGHVIHGEFTKPANYKFFKKMHALCRLCYDYFGDTIANREPLKYRGADVTLSYDMFRKEMTILAGFYTASYSLNGKVRLEADSWAWGNASEEKREKIFSAFIDVALQRVFQLTIDEATLKKMVDNVMGFDS